jgi:hypothetical protein
VKSRMSGFFVALLLTAVCVSVQAVTLGISKDGRYFTIDGRPTYLNGISYYGAQAIPDETWITKDLDDMAADHLNWIRIWAFWGNPKDNVAALTPNGEVRQPYMDRLKNIITECNKRNIIVDVTMNRNPGVPPSNQKEHLACAKVLARELLPYRNVYIDVSNERDVGDARFVSFPEVGELIAVIKAIDPNRICTASGTPGSKADISDYLVTGHCDFVSPHLSRETSSAAKTVGAVREMIGWMKELGRRAPIHLQEPFRRGYNEFEPTQDDFYRDDTGAKIAGAAGWCLHNGSTRGRGKSEEERPQRSFGMARARLYDQLDAVEREVSDNMSDRIGGNNPSVLRFQAEYPEQIEHEIGRRNGIAWSADSAQDKPGYLTNGPCVIDAVDGRHRVTWRLMTDSVEGNGDEIAVLDVSSGGKVLASKSVTRKSLGSPSTWKDVSLTFKTEGQKTLEFRTYWTGKSNLQVDHVTYESSAK